MSIALNPNTQNTADPSPTTRGAVTSRYFPYRCYEWIKKHPLTVIAIGAILAAAAVTANNTYTNWQNRQRILECARLIQPENPSIPAALVQKCKDTPAYATWKQSNDARIANVKRIENCVKIAQGDREISPRLARQCLDVPEYQIWSHKFDKECDQSISASFDLDKHCSNLASQYFAVKAQEMMGRNPSISRSYPCEQLKCNFLLNKNGIEAHPNLLNNTYTVLWEDPPQNFDSVRKAFCRKGFHFGETCRGILLKMYFYTSEYAKISINHS